MVGIIIDRECRCSHLKTRDHDNIDGSCKSCSCSKYDFNGWYLNEHGWVSHDYIGQKEGWLDVTGINFERTR